MLPKRMMSVKESNYLTEKVCEFKQFLKNLLKQRNTFGDRIIIQDEVLVYEGDKLKFKSKGHFVNQGLIACVNWFALNSLNLVTAVPSNTWGTNGTMRVGTGTGVTQAAMTALVTEVATAPNSVSGATANPVVGTYRVAWIATWNAGTLTAITVTEIGLKLNISVVLHTFGATYGGAIANSFVSRLSSSDGDFTAFVVNVAVPLTIEWRLTFTFA